MQIFAGNSMDGSLTYLDQREQILSIHGHAIEQLREGTEISATAA